MRLGPDLCAVVREILPEEQLLFQANLGVRLAEAKAFACREGRSSPRDVRAVTGLAGADARAVLERLAVQGLVSPLEGAETPVFVVAEHLQGRLVTDQVSDQVDAGPPDLVTDQAGARQDDLSTAQVPSGQEDLSTTYAHK